MIDPTSIYNDVFFSQSVHQALVAGNIIRSGDDARSLMHSLLARLEGVERLLGEGSGATSLVLSDLEDLIRRGVCTLGSPLLTNVSFSRATLSSCCAVPLPPGTFSSGHAALASSYYKLNMGSGYNLDAAEDPVSVLYQLNEHAHELTRDNTCERYIGNMAHLSVHHPDILKFIAAKIVRSDVLHFNISVDVSEAFMRAVELDEAYTLSDGRMASASAVWDELIACAWACGDPGIISLDRFNQGNALRDISPYVTTAPCGEVGLAKGESCVFGYVNIAACLRRRDGALVLDEGLVDRAATCLTRVLDDALEGSLAGYPTASSTRVMADNRKIGIGVCGFADALLLMELSYGSQDACALLNRAMSAINFSSKQASMELSARRGAFKNFGISRYRSEPGYLSRCSAFAANPGRQEWLDLERAVATHGLRNAMTTALPPSGRSSILLGVNSSIEPFLSFTPGSHSPLLCRLLSEQEIVKVGKRGEVVAAVLPGTSHMTARPSLYRRAIDIPPPEHLAVLKEAAPLVDDGISKTVNLPEHASQGDVSEIFLNAWRAGLKAISLYREPQSPDEVVASAA